MNIYNLYVVPVMKFSVEVVNNANICSGLQHFSALSTIGECFHEVKCKLHKTRNSWKRAITYSFSGNLRVEGDQYSNSPLASADITTS